MNELDRLFKFVSDKIIIANTIENDGEYYRFKFWIGGRYKAAYTFRFKPPSTITCLHADFDIADPSFDPCEFAMWFETHICGNQLFRGSILGRDGYIILHVP